MKVLHIINSLEIGGAELLLIQSIQELIDTTPSIQHHVMALYSGGPLEKDFYALSGCSILGFKKNVVGLYKIFQLRKFIIKNKVDIVHTHLFDSMIVARLAVPKSVRLFSTYHSALYDKSNIFYSKKHLFIDRLTFKKRHILLFVSNTVKENIVKALRIGYKRKYVLENFCDKRFYKIYQFKSTETLKLIAVGNLKIEKNYELAVEALGLINNPAISLDIYGEGYNREKLQQLIVKYNLQNNIFLKGNKKITSEIHFQYDAFLMTSYAEGMPVALLEALTSGLPAILNNIPELHESAETAGIYFDRNSSAGLVKVLEKVIKEKNSLKHLSEEAIWISKKYSITNHVQRLKELYHNYSNVLKKI